MGEDDSAIDEKDDSLEDEEREADELEDEKKPELRKKGEEGVIEDDDLEEDVNEGEEGPEKRFWWKMGLKRCVPSGWRDIPAHRHCKMQKCSRTVDCPLGLKCRRACPRRFVKTYPN